MANPNPVRRKRHQVAERLALQIRFALGISREFPLAQCLGYPDHMGNQEVLECWVDDRLTNSQAMWSVLAAGDFLRELTDVLGAQEAANDDHY